MRKGEEERVRQEERKVGRTEEREKLAGNTLREPCRLLFYNLRWKRLFVCLFIELQNTFP